MFKKDKEPPNMKLWLFRNIVISTNEIGMIYLAINMCISNNRVSNTMYLVITITIAILVLNVVDWVRWIKARRGGW